LRITFEHFSGDAVKHLFETVFGWLASPVHSDTTASNSNSARDAEQRLHELQVSGRVQFLP
jgi:hypothetical protein